MHCVVRSFVCRGVVVRRDINLHTIDRGDGAPERGAVLIAVEAYVTGMRRVSPISNRDRVYCGDMHEDAACVSVRHEQPRQRWRTLTTIYTACLFFYPGFLWVPPALVSPDLHLQSCAFFPLLSYPFSVPLPPILAPPSSPSNPSHPTPQPHSQTPRHELLLCDLPPFPSGDTLSLCVRQNRGGEAVGALSPEGRCVKLGYACLILLELGGCQR